MQHRHNTEPFGTPPGPIRQSLQTKQKSKQEETEERSLREKGGIQQTLLDKKHIMAQKGQILSSHWCPLLAEGQSPTGIHYTMSLNLS